MIAAGDLPAIRYGQPRPEGDVRRGGAIRIPEVAVLAYLDYGVTAPEASARLGSVASLTDLH
ncbi:hypothetical protein [Streptomyces sp. NPDC002550]